MTYYKKVGTSVAHDAIEYNDPVVAAERRAMLWQAGLRYLRVNMPHWHTETNNTPFRDKLRQYVSDAIDEGFYVIWGYSRTLNLALPNIDPATWASYANAQKAIATWSNGLSHPDMFELSLGNEEENRLSGMSVSTYIANQLTLATDVKAIFTGGQRVSVTSTTQHYANWKAQMAGSGLGSLDHYGLNVYGGPTHFDTYVKALARDFPNGVGYIPEWNAADNGQQDFASTDAYNREQLRRFILLRNLRLRHLPFIVWSDPTAQRFVMIETDGAQRDSWRLLRSPRTLIYATNPLENPGTNFIKNPSFEASTEGWTAENSATLARVNGYGALPASLAHAVLTSTSSGGRVSVQPLSGRRFHGMTAVLSWYAQAGTSDKMYVEALIGGTPAHIQSYELTQGSFTRYVAKFKITGSGTGGAIYFYPKQHGTTTTGSILIDCVQLEFFKPSVPAYAMPTNYMDGGMQSVAWESTPNNSYSRRYGLVARFHV